MRTSEIYLSKPEIIETNHMSDQGVLDKLKNGGWVDASAALRAISRRDDAWKGKHRGETLIPVFIPIPLEDNLRTEGARRPTPPRHGDFSLK